MNKTNPKDSIPSKPDAYPLMVEEQVLEIFILRKNTHVNAGDNKTEEAVVLTKSQLEQALQKAFIAGSMKEAEHTAGYIKDAREDERERMRISLTKAIEARSDGGGGLINFIWTEFTEEVVTEQPLKTGSDG